MNNVNFLINELLSEIFQVMVCQTKYSVMVFSTKPEGRRPFGLECGMILQVSNIIFPDENSGVTCE